MQVLDLPDRGWSPRLRGLPQSLFAEGMDFESATTPISPELWAFFGGVAPKAYGSSQARGRIGGTAASNDGSEPSL